MAVVDITPSLQVGIMQPEMAVQYCNNYQLANTDVHFWPYYYISRTEPGVLQKIEKGQGNFPVSFISTNNYGNNGCGFKYNDGMEMHHYSVRNPDEAGVVGICRDITDTYRTMIVSLGLSGCGFAVLIQEDKVYVIHSGASGNTGTDPVTRGRFINRDIYLMANALLSDNDYKVWYSNDKLEGMNNNVLYEKLRDMGFYGMIYVNNGEADATGIGNWFERQLALYAYSTKETLHDVIALINENKTFSSVIRPYLNGKINSVILQNTSYLDWRNYAASKFAGWNI